jgi:thiamine pyrophosphokinase
MKKKIVIIGNGTINDINFHKNLLKNIDIIICADGGATNAKKMNIIPDYIIGDLDSTSSDILEFFKNKKTKIIKDNNQNKTDMELAISLAESLNPNEILILGAIGYRIDHTIANILCLNKIKSNIKTQIIDNKNIIELVDNSKNIIGEKNEIISIIPLTDVTDLTYDGMKWLVKNKNTEFGWFGISNKLTKKKANISLSKGKLLIIRVRD